MPRTTGNLKEGTGLTAPTGKDLENTDSNDQNKENMGTTDAWTGHEEKHKSHVLLLGP